MLGLGVTFVSKRRWPHREIRTSPKCLYWMFPPYHLRRCSLCISFRFSAKARDTTEKWIEVFNAIRSYNALRGLSPYLHVVQFAQFFHFIVVRRMGPWQIPPGNLYRIDLSDRNTEGNWSNPVWGTVPIKKSAIEWPNWQINFFLLLFHSINFWVRMMW